MRPRRVVCNWCGKNICITSNDDLFYVHYYLSVLNRGERKLCPNSGKDSNIHGRRP